MKSFIVVRRQLGFVVAITALLLALVAPALVSAADVTTRSISLSSASKGATSVSYEVKFTTSTAGANAFVVDFCSDSPAIGATCTAPTGMDASSAASSTVGFTTVTGSTSKFSVGASSSIGASTAVDVTVTGIDNPSGAGTVYARIVTYDTKAHADSYTSTSLGTGSIDTGSVALAIHDTISVSAAVQESMTFCVSNATLTANCANAATPSLELGEGSGATKALASSAVSSGDLFTQISTNAASGAIVSLKSSATGCGGLINSSKPSGCYIGPAQALGITAGQALFGVKVAADTDPDGGSNSTGTFQAVAASGYNSSTFAFNYNTVDESTGVTSVFGDPFLDTNGAPAANKNMKLTFGASVSNATPAGQYSTNLSLIATGKF